MSKGRRSGEAGGFNAIAGRALRARVVLCGMIVWQQAGRWAVGAALIVALLWVALWNGYPTFYPDSATYLECGFLLETPVDRPITYGLFLWATSLGGLTLWTTVLSQAALLAWCCASFVRLFLPHGWAVPVLITAGVSGVSFLASQIVTDVFAPIMVLAMVLFVCSERRRWAWLAVFLISCAMHTSHLLLAFCLLFPLTALYAFARRTAWIVALKRSLALVIAAGIAYVALNISVVKSSEAFYAAHLAGTGDLQEYLERSCPEKGYDLCSMTPIPRSAEQFLWDQQGILHRYASRDALKADLGRVIGDMFRDPASRRAIISSTGRMGLEQMGRFAVGEGNIPFPPGSSVHRRMERFFPQETARFERMAQNDRERFGQLVERCNRLYTPIVVASVIVLIVCAVAFAWRGERLYPASVVLVLLAYGCNAYINAGLVLVANRFGAKLAWCPTLMAVVGLALLYRTWRTVRNGLPPHGVRS